MTISDRQHDLAMSTITWAYVFALRGLAQETPAAPFLSLAVAVTTVLMVLAAWALATEKEN